MRRLDTRLAAMEARAGGKGCAVCREWQPVVLLFLTHTEAKDPARRAAKMPYPATCPRCGRHVIRGVREYIGAREANI